MAGAGDDPLGSGWCTRFTAPAMMFLFLSCDK